MSLQHLPIGREESCLTDRLNLHSLGIVGLRTIAGYLLKRVSREIWLRDVRLAAAHQHN